MAKRCQTKLVEIMTALFGFQSGHRELMRLAFATCFASPGELPDKMNYLRTAQTQFRVRPFADKKRIESRTIEQTIRQRRIGLRFLGVDEHLCDGAPDDAGLSAQPKNRRRHRGVVSQRRGEQNKIKYRVIQFFDGSNQRTQDIHEKENFIRSYIGGAGRRRFGGN